MQNHLLLLENQKKMETRADRTEEADRLTDHRVVAIMTTVGGTDANIATATVISAVAGAGTVRLTATAEIGSTVAEGADFGADEVAIEDILEIAAEVGLRRVTKLLQPKDDVRPNYSTNTDSEDSIRNS